MSQNAETLKGGWEKTNNAVYYALNMAVEVQAKLTEERNRCYFQHAQKARIADVS
jgi:hypothetical protein